MKAYLCLQDGRVFEGESIGMAGETAGEVVFNTSMTGYQEILTDPSYAGQIIVLTYPLIGNYGVNGNDEESPLIAARGLAVKELCPQPSNYRAEQNLHRYLVKHGIVGIKDIDTRALTRHLRQAGTMMGLISTEADPEVLKRRARELAPLAGPGLVKSVTCQEAFTLEGGTHPVVVVDFGAKGNIVRSLRNLGCRVTVVPAGTGAAGILAYRPQGVVLSNGPGDPQDVAYALPAIREVLEAGVPVMGICLGHQLLGLALGGRTYKLKFGHRGGNHPVKDLRSNRVYITSQNHGYAVAPDSLPGDELEVTHINLHDQTVEGLRHKKRKAFSVQFHPEACPGPQDTFYLFSEFLDMVREYAAKTDGEVGTMKGVDDRGA
ncbi:MAG: glutamine-hydrolyzing carbamoyl-phosphate synthase small subunit [Peptococcaceae bacterium]|nr:glutamine-hydrolyzing carbamoyl-phosphate synthase small subunit [Peptococcaceae bacterium]MDH7526315.1 glutamine-hydrolyzing carbamoyl-phosphate synthase small subunit [Peptococcaceae bacterium]